ncbi:cytochrome c-type biogenesis protein CcmE [Psychrobacter sp. PL15]|uniref:cytochrome c maturation protein CcmE n=1 Tax=unclassified Psychrobacter TaxID=196806 RepID=UPI001AE9C639|nr:cytochrome c maturation protein CcmE [Psychrobacter sp. PL15]MEC5209342.1 cytochrome c-type biogenesis protein CcmE [Psychrobacter sp. PL15]
MNAVRRKKLMWVLFTFAGAVVAVGLILYAIGQKTDYYFDPTAIAEGEAPQDTRIRAGGMVVAGSVQRAPDDPLSIEFAITDFQSTVPVTYQGILPDLFAENSGIVATGKMQGETFVAGEVLAKHDEKYMPPEVANSLKENNRLGATPSSEQYNPAEPVYETKILEQ